MKETTTRLRTTVCGQYRSLSTVVRNDAHDCKDPDKVPTGLLRSGQAAENVTFQVYPDIWRQGTSSEIWEGQRMHFLVEQCQPGRAGNKFEGADRVQTGGGTRGNVTNLWMVGGKAAEHWLSAEAASLGCLVQ